VNRPRSYCEKALAKTEWPYQVDAMPQREINAKDILRDIRSGMNEKSLMEKYRLSPIGLKALFEEMIAARLLERSEDGSIRASIKRIEASKIVPDILSGKTAHELISHYGLSATLLQDLSRQLVESKTLRRDQLGRELLLRMDAAIPSEIRSEAREKVDFEVDVFESERSNIVGKVLDVNKGGLRTIGMPAVPQTVKTIHISGDVLGQFESFHLEAQCQWAKGSLDCKDLLAGHRITSITKESSRELEKLIALAKMGTQSNPETLEDTGDGSSDSYEEDLVAASPSKTEGWTEGKKKVNAKGLLADIRAGMDDDSLMAKYKLSARGVLRVMNRLIWEGLMTPSELEARRSLAKTLYMPVFKCPVCNEVQFVKTETCPKCGSHLRSLSEKKRPFG
jgi:Mor family transcriptional regulator